MENGELSNTATIPKVIVHSVLSIKEVTFSANHPIDQDTAAPNFPPPEWDSIRDKQWPVCYTRTKNVKLKAKFEVIGPPTATESVKIKGVAKLGSATLEWTDSVSVSPGTKDVTTSEMTSSAALPNEVACYDPATIEWKYEPPAVGEDSAGNSANVMYVTLGDPSVTAYWTLLDISCRAAHGATNAAQLISKAYVPFTSRTLTRVRDGKGLTYWNPIGPNNARDTSGLLSKTNAPGGGASGECGSWAEFLIDMYKVHGESARKVEVVLTRQDINARLANDPAARGFLVKDWIFMGHGSLPIPFTHVMGTECVPFPVPGQRCDKPPNRFWNHFIVWALGQLYDPSYGSPPVTTPLEWENASIDGLFVGFQCGVPKAYYLNRQLLQFHWV